MTLVWWTELAGGRTHRRVCVVFGDAGMKDSSEQLCTYHLSAVLSINRHAFVLTDTLLKWNETS